VHHVADLLAAKPQEPVIGIDPLASVFDAIELMNAKNIGAVLVLIDGYLVGIVSERDFVRRSVLDHTSAKETRVSEIMTREPVSVTEEDTVVHCVSLVQGLNVRHLPVVKAGKPVGMVSLRDLFLDVIHDKSPGC
jgi:CBS domain-containing protein